MKALSMKSQKTMRLYLCWVGMFLLGAPSIAMAAQIDVAVSRSALVKTNQAMGEVIIADPAVADVHAHGEHYLSVIGKKPGITSLRLFNKDRGLIQSYDVMVGYDLVELRRALKNFLPDEIIGVEMVGGNVALTGNVSSAESAERAERIASEVMGVVTNGETTSPLGVASVASAGASPSVMNLLKVTSGQQVMLRVRVGEIQRTALRTLGVDLQTVSNVGSGSIVFGTGGGIGALVAPSAADTTALSAGQFVLPGGRNPTNTRGIFSAVARPGNDTIGGLIKALERDGLFKLLAEPNLVAVSGEKAEFLAGGEIPIPVPQGGSGEQITIEYKPFGVSVQFRPFVLNENRIRMEVQPEVSELDDVNALVLNGFRIPAISTRRASTTVELAPGKFYDRRVD